MDKFQKQLYRAGSYQLIQPLEVSTIQISNITANGCYIQLQTNDYQDSGNSMKKASFVVTENYVATVSESTEPAKVPHDKKTRRFDAKTLSAVSSLFKETMNNAHR